MLRAAIMIAAAPACAALRVPLMLRPSHAMRCARNFMSAAPDFKAQITETVSGSQVVVYSKSYCPYCAKAKDLFDGMGQSYVSIELDQLDKGAEIQETLQTMTGQRTVPSIFVSGEHLGGCDDATRAAASGKLKKMLGK